MDGLFLYKIKKSITISYAFQNILNEAKRKPNKIYVDKGNDFYNRSMKLKDNELYSAHNEKKSIVDEIFIRTLKNKIYKYMTSISKNAYIKK